MSAYYESEYGKLYFGDCLEIMPSLQEKVELVLTDPPYGTTQCKWDSVIPLEKMWEAIRTCCRNNSAILLFSDGIFMCNLMQSNEKEWRYNLVWDKVLTTGFLNANKMPLRKHEEICVFYRSLPVYNPQKKMGEKNHGNRKPKIKGSENYNTYESVDNSEKLGSLKHPTSIISIPKSHPSIVTHPTQKPVALMEYLIRTYTNFGDTVLDFTIGSGTTAVAAINTGRKFIGVEKEEKYCEIAKQRIIEAEEKMKEFEV